MSTECPSYGIIIERLIKHEDEQDYYLQIPFEMPENTEDLYVEIVISPIGEGSCVIDMGVLGPSRVHGWSGGARQSFHIGLERATPSS